MTFRACTHYENTPARKLHNLGQDRKMDLLFIAASVPLLLCYKGSMTSMPCESNYVDYCSGNCLFFNAHELMHQQRTSESFVIFRSIRRTRGRDEFTQITKKGTISILKLQN